MNKATDEIKKKALNVKGSMFTATVLQLQTTDLNAIATQLTELTVQAPQFFQQAPTVIDVSAVDTELASLNFEQLLHLLKTAGLLPVGMVGADPTHAILANQAGLPCMPESKHYKPAAKTSTPPQPSTPIKAASTMVIENPIRSGQRIYAKDSDLVILGSVSHGAEILADGHIHIYGALHGRALAGANGNTAARIFCQRLNAELVAIAGLYQLSESFSDKQNTGAVYISYQQDTLLISPLTI